MLYEIREIQSDRVDFVVSDSTCVIASAMVEGTIKGYKKPTLVFLIAPGIPPVSTETHYATPVETWPLAVTTKP